MQQAKTVVGADKVKDAVRSGPTARTSRLIVFPSFPIVVPLAK